ARRRARDGAAGRQDDDVREVLLGTRRVLLSRPCTGRGEHDRKGDECRFHDVAPYFFWYAERSSPGGFAGAGSSLICCSVRMWRSRMICRTPLPVRAASAASSVALS